MRAVSANGVRTVRRGLYERLERFERERRVPERRRVPVLLVGAGQAGVLAAKEITGRGDLRLDVKGFLDDDPEKLGSVINGIRSASGSFPVFTRSSSGTSRLYPRRR